MDPDAPANTPAEHLVRARARIQAGRDRDARSDLALARDSLGDQAEIELAFLDLRAPGALESARRVARRIVDSADPGSALRARACHVLGLAEGKLRDGEASVAALLEARAIYRGREEESQVAQVEDTLGSVFMASGRMDLAMHHYALSIVRKALAGDDYGVALTLGNMGRLHLRAGRTTEARECFELDLSIARKHGDRRGEVRMLEDLGRVALAEGDLERAQELLERSHTMASAEGYDDLRVFALNDLSRVLLAKGDAGRAVDAFEAARESLPEGGDPSLETMLAATSGRLLLASGQAGALNVLEQAVFGFAKADLPDQEIDALVFLAEALTNRGRREAAEVCLRRALARARRDGYARHLPAIREQMERLDLGEGVAEERGRVVFDLPDPRKGRVLGATDSERYVLLQSLGKGGFGTVFRAYDAERHVVVALKRFELEGLYDGETRRQLLASARTELEAVAGIRHPGVAGVLAVGTDTNGSTYVVQELVEGTSLRGLMDSERQPQVETVLVVLEHLALALDELHRHAVVHRDLKPANVLLRASDGLPVLIDFGIAFLPRRVALFDPNLILGTFLYMAPEQAIGDPLGPSADVYALGVLTFEWLAGEVPLVPRGADLEALARDIAERAPAPLAKLRPDLPAKLVGLVGAMLAKAPEVRPTAREVAEACQELRRTRG